MSSIQPTDVCWEFQATSHLSYADTAARLFGKCDLPDGYVRHDASPRVQYTVLDATDDRPVHVAIRYTGDIQAAKALVASHRSVLDSGTWYRYPPRLGDATHVVTYTYRTPYGDMTRTEAFTLSLTPSWTNIMKQVLRQLDSENQRTEDAFETQIRILSVLPV